MQVFKFFTVHAADKVGNQIHRARTVQGHKGNDLFKLARLSLHQHAAHACRLELEYRSGIAFGKNVLVGIGIV